MDFNNFVMFYQHSNWCKFHFTILALKVMFWSIWLERVFGCWIHYATSNFNWLWWAKLNYTFLNCALGNWKYSWCLFTVTRIEWHDFEIMGFCNGIIIIEVNVVLLKLFFSVLGMWLVWVSLNLSLDQKLLNY
jgi:hypothetical protein